MLPLLLAFACSQPAPEPTSAVPGERAEVMPGTICAQLDKLTAGDPWKLPGRDLPSDDPSVKVRVLTLTTDWAEQCTVNRMGDLDVGPSCARSYADANEAHKAWVRLESDFKSCHDGWTLTDESDSANKEWVAERGAALHFLRLRSDDRGSWQLSVGAMPLD